MVQGVNVLVIGMAGAGKSSLLAAMAGEAASLPEYSGGAYVVNLDPAVMHVPFQPRVDIRRTVGYKDVMQQYGLGPNGAIMTALNLFATRFDQVLALMAKEKTKREAAGCAESMRLLYLLDTPGQLEAFTWSASGQLISAALASEAPTVLVYVVDAVRCAQNPTTFMSNMLYAVSILYKLRLPMVVALNKSDLDDTSVVETWMHDLDAFREALRADDRYINSYSRSLGLVLERFYQTLVSVRVSAASGLNLSALLKAITDAADEYAASPEAAELRKRMATQRDERDRLNRDLAFEKSAQSSDILRKSEWQEEDHLNSSNQSEKRE